MPFNLFHKKKPEEQQTPAVPLQETQPAAESQAKLETPEGLPQEVTPATPVPLEEPVPVATPVEPPMEQPQPEPQPTVEPQATPEPVPGQQNEVAAEAPSKTYLKAMPLKDLVDLDNVKNEVQSGNIIILKITPLAQKSIEDVKSAVNDLFQFAENIGGDIARLGEERVVICPKTVRIWREKTPKSVANEPLPSAA
jgi:SepF-like predicted cell division protein (DUF552 family)